LLAALGLWVLFEIPTIFRPRGADPWAIRPTGDFLVLLTLYVALRGSRHERALLRVWKVLAVVLVAVRIDWSLCWLITRSRPLFYDQLFLLRHLVVLVGDLWSAPMALVLLLLVLATVAVVLSSRLLLRQSAPLALPPLRRFSAIALAVAWGGVFLLSLSGPPASALTPHVRWMFPELATNVRDSYRTYLAVRRNIFDSPYKAYGDIRFSRQPNVTFMFVESYGRIIPDSPELAAPWIARLADMQRNLEAGGWHMASGFSTAPVSGGRSWLAVGSIFMGTALPYEALFRHLVREVQNLPTIPSFFAERGYDTIALEPSDRVRPGVEETNYYHVAEQIRFDDLRYRGPTLGWGLVPDQYALGFAEDGVLARSQRPRFFFFHMVSSHMPWSALPPLVDDWHTLDSAPGERVENAHDEHLSLFNRADALSTRLRRYGREEMQKWVKYPLVAGFRERYVATVDYDLSVIERHLLREHTDELVVVMGDHQPPAVSPDGENFDVPVHVFARDPALLAEFRAHGFSPGLVLDPKARPIMHAAIFSLLVRSLVGVQPGGGALPAYLPNGVTLGG
jgi:hypothetical protein